MGLDAVAKPFQTDIATIQNYYQQSASLLLYQSVLESDIGQAFIQLLATLILSETTDPAVVLDGTLSAKAARIISCRRAYGQWFLALATQQQSWQYHLIQQILIADNPFSQQAQRLCANIESLENSKSLAKNDLLDRFNPAILAAVDHDLAILHSLYSLSTEQISEWVKEICGGMASPSIQSFLEPKLPVHFPDKPEWTEAVAELATYYRNQGVGLFGRFGAFRWQSDSSTAAATGQLVGIQTPDPIRLSQLVSYDHPKQQLIQNTEALLQSYAAQNVLLYGSRGAGKSSLVKALLNEYRDRGLRLIEVPKINLPNLPQILEPLSHAPQKFIIFVDDLSFEDDDEDFKALKVVLEGGVTARPQNVVVYATSNRRHLIREFFDERPRPKDADEIQAWDTVQEKLSFSDRFGLTLTFSPADQPTYLTIVRELAAQADLKIEAENLDWRARQWATRNNGRSGRTARQFVDFLIAEQGMQ